MGGGRLYKDAGSRWSSSQPGVLGTGVAHYPEERVGGSALLIEGGVTGDMRTRRQARISGGGADGRPSLGLVIVTTSRCKPFRLSIRMMMMWGISEECIVI